MEFSRQANWSGLACPSPGDLPNPGIKPRSPACRQILYHLSHQRSPGKYGSTDITGIKIERRELLSRLCKTTRNILTVLMNIAVKTQKRLCLTLAEDAGENFYKSKSSKVIFEEGEVLYL